MKQKLSKQQIMKVKEEAKKEMQSTQDKEVNLFNQCKIKELEFMKEELIKETAFNESLIKEIKDKLNEDKIEVPQASTEFDMRINYQLSYKQKEARNRRINQIDLDKLQIVIDGFKEGKNYTRLLQ